MRTDMTHDSQPLMKGTLDMLIFKAIDRSPMHGWGIGQRIAAVSKGVFQIETGTLYPALHRLQRQRFITAGWRRTANGRRALYYALTASGRKRLKMERESWTQATAAVKHVLAADMRDAL